MKRSEHPVKKAFQLWMWWMQQISQPANMAMLALTLTLTVTNYIKWRFENPYIGMILTFLILASIIGTFGWTWDRIKMWHEQNVVNVERNPYQMLKMTPKEVFSYQTWWFPWLKQQGDEGKRTVELWEKWVKAQLDSDPHLKKQVQEMHTWLEGLT